MDWRNESENECDGKDTVIRKRPETLMTWLLSLLPGYITHLCAGLPQRLLAGYREKLWIPYCLYRHIRRKLR